MGNLFLSLLKLNVRLVYLKQVREKAGKSRKASGESVELKFYAMGRRRRLSAFADKD